jgi:hypothetical protein
MNQSSTCVACGQTFVIPAYAERPKGERGLLARVKCRRCRANQYGDPCEAQGEAVRCGCSRPAPAQIPGQLSLS